MDTRKILVPITNITNIQTYNEVDGVRITKSQCNAIHFATSTLLGHMEIIMKFLVPGWEIVSQDLYNLIFGLLYLVRKFKVKAFSKVFLIVEHINCSKLKIVRVFIVQISFRFTSCTVDVPNGQFDATVIHFCIFRIARLCHEFCHVYSINIGLKLFLRRQIPEC